MEEKEFYIGEIVRMVRLLDAEKLRIVWRFVKGITAEK